MLLALSLAIFAGPGIWSAQAELRIASGLHRPQLRGEAVSQDVGGGPADDGNPFIVGLRRESVPIYRQGKIASFKTSYSGILSMGTPAQEFRVVFDTGSGNIVLPALECKSEACEVEDRRRFNMSASSTAVGINEDGSDMRAGQAADQVTIGFGTGEITGEFTRDKVCFGSPAPPQSNSTTELQLAEATPSGSDELCVEMGVILAVEMSTQPFKTFRFDGILGLGLGGLAMSRYFSAFEMIMGTGLPAAHFGVFLSEGEDGEESQIAFGGVDAKRILHPLAWAPVAMPELGYWQVRILAIRVNGQELDFCRDGTCRGVVDTGTSHLGVPAPFDKELADHLIRDALDTLDCRLIEAPEVQIELPGYNLTLHPANYMRRLPLREGVSVSSQQGVYVPSSETNKTLEAPSSADPMPLKNASASPGDAPSAVNSTKVEEKDAEDAEVKRYCSPRFMPVRLPAPLGPKLFILGEPVLHRYYTVYDWLNHRVGFSLANTPRNTMDPSKIQDRRGVLPKEVDVLLMQESLVVKRNQAIAHPAVQSPERPWLEDAVAMVQVTLRLSVRQRRKA